MNFFRIDIKKHWKTLFSKGAERYNVVDGLRAWMILSVILFHIFLAYLGTQFSYESSEFLNFVSNVPFAWHILAHGDKGVDGFFVISGFLLSITLLGELSRTGKLNIRRFYIFRALRIYPVYLIIIILAIIVGGDFWKTAWIYIALCQNYLPIDKLILHHTWSLCVEMQFYLILPLLLLAIKRFRRQGLILFALFLAILGYRFWVIASEPAYYTVPLYKYLFDIVEGKEALYQNLYLHTLTRSAPLIFGVWCGYIVHKGGKLMDFFKSRKGALIGVSLAALCFTWVLGTPIFNPSSWYYQSFSPIHNFLYMGASRAIFGVGVGLVIICGIYGEGQTILRSILSWRLWKPISVVVLPLYLFHIAFLLLFGTLIANLRHGGKLALLTSNDVLLIGALTLFASFLFSAIIHILVERPGINLRRYFYPNK